MVAGLGAAAVKTAADFDSAMSQVAAISGAIGDDLEVYGACHQILNRMKSSP